MRKDPKVERPPYEVSASDLLEAGALNGWMDGTSEEWERAWDRLRDHDGTTEGWEYMGSVEVPARLSPTGEAYWFHSFRNRRHPITGDREYCRVQASEGWGSRNALPINPEVAG